LHDFFEKIKKMKKVLTAVFAYGNIYPDKGSACPMSTIICRRCVQAFLFDKYQDTGYPEKGLRL